MSSHPTRPDPPSAQTPNTRSLSGRSSVSRPTEPHPATLDPALEAALSRPIGRAAPDERYVHRGILASGGAGTVHAVEDRVLRRTVAVKRLHDTLGTRAGNAFLQEARVLASLDHPGIIPVHDYGVDSRARPYIVMKRVEGQDLSAWLKSLPEVQLRARHHQVRVLDHMRRVCDALGFAHGRGQVHFDLKPSNLMLGDFGQVYVVDWGNALSRRSWGRCLPKMSGTPSYMAPEQARCEAVGPWTDIFGIGATLYTLLVGRPPRSRMPIHAMHEASEAMPIRPPAGHSVPPGLMDLLLRCMAPDPIDRPLSMEQVAEALDLARHGTWMEPRVALTAGEAILREGEGGTAAYVVESGELEVVQEHSGHVRTLGPGDVFGELAALTGGIRSSSVIARTDCVLACIEGEKLVQALDMGNLGGRFVQALAQRLLDNERRDRGGSSDA